MSSQSDKKQPSQNEINQRMMQLYAINVEIAVLNVQLLYVTMFSYYSLSITNV